MPKTMVVESYEINLEGAALPIHHIDFYRQASPADWSSAGLRDLFAQQAIVLIEWPQRAAGSRKSTRKRSLEVTNDG